MLFDRYAAKLERLARGNLTKAALRRIEPEDIVQSVFRRFFASVDRGVYDVPKGSDLWSLLMVIALNRVRGEEMSQRAQTRDVRRTISFDDYQQPMTDPQLLTESDQAWSDLLLEDALRELPELHREAVRLRLRNHEVAEIASLLNRSKRTAERILQEARTQLMRLLELDESNCQSERDK